MGRSAEGGRAARARCGVVRRPVGDLAGSRCEHPGSDTIQTVAESTINPTDGGSAGPAPRRRGMLILIAAVLLAALIAGHRLIPNVGGLGSLVDSGTPFLGVGVPLLALAAVARRSRLALAAVLVPAVVWAGLFGAAWLPSGVDGPVLSVKYKDGDKKVLVTPETAVVTYVVGAKSDLKPGIKIFVGAGKKQADGTVQTPRVTYGKDGLTPPM